MQYWAWTCELLGRGRDKHVTTSNETVIANLVADFPKLATRHELRATRMKMDKVAALTRMPARLRVALKLMSLDTKTVSDKQMDARLILRAIRSGL